MTQSVEQKFGPDGSELRLKVGQRIITTRQSPFKVGLTGTVVSYDTYLHVDAILWDGHTSHALYVKDRFAEGQFAVIEPDEWADELIIEI